MSDLKSGAHAIELAAQLVALRDVVGINLVKPERGLLAPVRKLALHMLGLEDAGCGHLLDRHEPSHDTG